MKIKITLIYMSFLITPIPVFAHTSFESNRGIISNLISLGIVLISIILFILFDKFQKQKKKTKENKQDRKRNSVL
tara:strand:- start:57 stop:281 length:225 start_codon:yes stop_codon:yes gene_type:complete